jgi:Uncharacterized protein conserved in bacteria (DUF2272)
LLKRLLGVGAAAFALILGACAPMATAVAPGALPDDSHIPPYARRPYQPFSRNAAVQIARREWRAFGSPVVVAGEALPYDAERADGLWQRVGDYWWQGLAMGAPDQAITGEHDQTGLVFPAIDNNRYAWSAVFIDYVMRMAGAGHRFSYSPLHADYINAAKQEALGERHDLAIVAEPPESYAPQPGDLVCMWRGDRPIRYADLPGGNFAAHCDIVVATHRGSIDGIGGNVADTVALWHIPTTTDGHLVAANGTIVDPNHPWFVVLRVIYDIDGPIVSPFIPAPAS